MTNAYSSVHFYQKCVCVCVFRSEVCQVENICVECFHKSSIGQMKWWLWNWMMKRQLNALTYQKWFEAEARILLKHRTAHILSTRPSDQRVQKIFHSWKSRDSCVQTFRVFIMLCYVLLYCSCVRVCTSACNSSFCCCCGFFFCTQCPRGIPCFFPQWLFFFFSLTCSLCVSVYPKCLWCTRFWCCKLSVCVRSAAQC